MSNVIKLERGDGIGPAPDRCTPEQKQAWDELVMLIEPGFLIRMDCIWMELTARSIALIRQQTIITPEDISAVCYLLKGLTLGPDSLPKLGLGIEWLLLPEEE